MSILKKDFTYIDLFAGIGGFRLAMQTYSNKSKCLYASEINNEAARTYELNFKQKPLGDIRKINPIELGFSSPDVICAGFPCQTFSKGGLQAGFKDSRGTLFREIIRIIEAYEFSERPKILILENVQNLINHDFGNTWKTIYHEISLVGYNVVKKPIVIAPKDVGVPQLRNRAIILAVRKDIYNGPIEINVPKTKQNTLDIKSVLDFKNQNKEDYLLDEEQLRVLNCWNEFINIVPRQERIIGFPIWSDEFGCEYDITQFPLWKQNIINKNRKLYKSYKKQIDSWMTKWNVRNSLSRTNKKFEWQAGTDIENIFEGIIQFRTSGIRVKRPTESPALVAIDHRPIYGPEKRYITEKEGLRLQSFPDDYMFLENKRKAFAQLGNAVNVKVIESMFKMFVEFIERKKEL
ncbi:DNA cytosine methyltransferase [Mycoplasma struthionis]|uniref:Cytosine-specific methyltransferase n=1 Tax=Mycoplasma struthionis TaxID=538220 RepID=A0A502M2L2_9MOLU|nr:DNA (cytosine-5-)-methyltransferase [Mycoplasma struthionis]TPI02370.1 DNA cytosine methyltransferase [Mycoplasma struthionis]